MTIDRPLGSHHPHNPDLAYPVNYGYVPGTVAGDGEAIDASVLGPHGPLAQAEGVVVAIVVRRDDDEDKLVVAVDGHAFTLAEIAALVAFQERYFDSEVIGRDGSVRGTRS